MGGRTFGWLEVDRIGEELAERHRGLDPLSIRFTDLKRMVQELPGFAEDAGHPVNEKILEAIQSVWKRELDDDAEDDSD